MLYAHVRGMQKSHKSSKFEQFVKIFQIIMMIIFEKNSQIIQICMDVKWIADEIIQKLMNALASIVSIVL